MSSQRLLIGLVVACTCFSSSALGAVNGGRERIRIDNDWRFHLGDFGANVPSVPITDWRMSAPSRGPTGIEAIDPGTLRSVRPEQYVFGNRPGFAWFRTTLPAFGGPNRLLHFEGVDDNATVYVNGKLLRHHEGWDDPFDVPVDSVWRSRGPNVAEVQVENTGGDGRIGVSWMQHPTHEDSRPAQVGFPAASWRTVDLPHDFVVEGTFTPKASASHGSLPTNVGWYRKTLFIPAGDKGRRLWVDFDGMYRDATVWLNGQELGRHPSGYIGVRYDITDKVKYGHQNLIAVKVDARKQEGWWYEGGGIYRHVWLTKTNPVHIAPAGLFVRSEPVGENAKVTIEVTVANESNQTSFEAVSLDIVSPTGLRVASIGVSGSMAPKSTHTWTPTILFAHPMLWSLEEPNLYKVVARVSGTRKDLDRVSANFGVRSLRWDAKTGFYLNGKHVEIQGTCNHQDFIGTGTAMPDSILEWRIKKLKEMGANAYRMSHNPPAPELLDACDRLGMLVMDENRHLGGTYHDHTSAGTPIGDLQDLKDMIVRDRNHPSIIMWSMCNEEGLQSTPEGARIFAAMRNATLALDPTRPVTCAMNGGWGRGISLVEDLQGCNYNVGGYDSFHARFPNKPMYGSETTSFVSTRGEYAADPVEGYVSSYDTTSVPWGNTAESAWKAMADRPFIAGGYIWTGFDYKGEPTPYGWPCVNSHFGIMDMCGFPKDTYYYYQSWWKSTPVMHIEPNWNHGGIGGDPVNVWVYSNADSVELILNGRSLGIKAMPRNGHLEWQVPWESGRLAAVGTKDGRPWAKDVAETTGAPSQIRLVPDRSHLTKDTEDLVPVVVEVLDARGRIVPDAANRVSFRVTGAGRVAGVGNGDPSDHDGDKASTRRAFHGLCMVLVGSGGRAGSLRLTASSPGLATAEVPLSVR